MTLAIYICCGIGIAACLIGMLCVHNQPGHRADGCIYKSPGHLRDERQRAAAKLFSKERKKLKKDK